MDNDDMAYCKIFKINWPEVHFNWWITNHCLGRPRHRERKIKFIFDNSRLDTFFVGDNINYPAVQISLSIISVRIYRKRAGLEYCHYDKDDKTHS